MNYYQYLSYIVNIYENNYKNNFYAAIANNKIEKNYIYKVIYIVILMMRDKI